MASLDPSDEEISQVVDFAGLDSVNDRSMIINALKNNNRNVETVVMQYFDNQASFRDKYTMAWNDAMFSADRDGSTNNTGISFHIESLNQNDVIQGVTPPPPAYGVGAPSRPPSRSNDRSPLGRVVEWTTGDSTGGAIIHSQEDVDMQRALRQSAEEAGISLAQQESGIMDASTSTPYFGPANRPDYDQGSWAMVPVGKSEKKVPSGPTPSQRRRVAGTPAFLIQGATNTAASNRLGGLLTIFHQVPLARNILLDCGYVAPSYGYSSEWWNGQEIQPQSAELSWNEPEGCQPGFEQELHRLMAFLDSTERSYGTVSVLTDLTPYASNGVEKQFFERLGEQNADKLEPLSQEAIMAPVSGDEPSTEEAKFALLEINFMRGDYANVTTLYEALDHLMWSDVLSWNETYEGAKMAMFTQMGEIVTIKIGNDGPEDSIDIPTELYPEKYLASRKDEARRIQVGWCKNKNEILKIEKEEKSLQQWRNDWDQPAYNKTAMIDKVKAQWSVFRQYLDGAGRFQVMEVSGFDTNKYPDYRAAPSQMTDEQQQYSKQVDDVLQLTERVLSDIETKTQNLRKQLETLQAKQRFLGRLLTKPDKERPKPFTCKKYLLRGVATDKDIIYVCQRLEPDLIELDGEEKLLDQWWRLAYAPNEDPPVQAEKIEVERVLREVWQITKTPVIIYATENALSTPRAPLSDPLDLFVRSENRAFRQELNQETTGGVETRRRGSVEPISPSKRKHRTDSMDSMNSNRASIGSDDRNPFESPFDDQMESIETELTDMSGSRSEMTRSADGETKVGEPHTPPPLPNRDPAHTGNKSVTLTPETLAADENEVPRLAPLEGNQFGDESQTTIVEENETKPPEMKERGRPLTFMAMGLQTENGERLHSSMDMAIPDHQE